MNTTQLTALCQRYQAILLDADNDAVHIAVVDAPSHELLDAVHFATTRRIDIVCWTRQQMEGHTHAPRKILPAIITESSMVVVLTIVLLLFIAPFILVVINVFKTKADINTEPLALCCCACCMVRRTVSS